MAEHLLHSVILFVIGTIAAIINVNAGGGSTLTVPALIFLGLDAATANGTNRIAILLQNVSAVRSFQKEKYSQFKLSWKLSLLAVPGAVIGALTAVEISDQLFKNILAVVMIGIIITILFPGKKNTTTEDSEDKKLTLPVILSFIFVGFYGGIIQVGIGFILMAILQKLMKFSLVYVNMHKVFIVLVFTVPALMVFILSGKVNWYLGLSLALGNMFGAWWAAKLSIKKGEKFIKVILVIAILIMSVKLLNIF